MTSPSFNTKLRIPRGLRFISVHQFIIMLFLISAVLGYVISIGKLYLFHIVTAFILVLILLGVVKVRVSTLRAVKYPFIFLLYSTLTLLWTPNIVNGLYYVFYLICGFSILFIVNNYVVGKVQLDFTYKVLTIFFLLNFLIGLLETTGYFRLPVPNRAVSSEILGSRPTGFNDNLNNFGFVFLIIFPYLYIYPKKIIKYISLVVLLWFTIKLQSKGFLVASIFFFIFYFLVNIEKKSFWYKTLFTAILIVILYSLIGFFFNDTFSNNRAFSAFEQIERGMDLIRRGSSNPQDSTSVRSFMYYYGFLELIKSHGLGLGLAGIATVLAQNFNFFVMDTDIYSFHNFFLEMLIDLGIFPFLFIMYSYWKVISKNLKISKRSLDNKMRYYSKASALSLLVAIPASISPSNIIYVFPFWLVLAFALSVIKVSK